MAMGTSTKEDSNMIEKMVRIANIYGHLRVYSYDQQNSRTIKLFMGSSIAKQNKNKSIIFDATNILIIIIKSKPIYNPDFYQETFIILFQIRF